MQVSRRRALALGAAGLSALAGCGDRGPGRTLTAVFVTNDTDESVTVTLRAFELPAGVAGGEEGNDGGTEDGGGASEERRTETETGTPTETPELEQVLARRDTLAPEAQYTIEGEDLPAGDLRMAVATGDGPSGSYDWPRDDEFSTLDVRVAPSNVRFTELD